MRVLAKLAAVALLGLTACTPEIGSGTYYCGPNALCPPDLECDGNDFTCKLPALVSAFECPEGSELFEPDDSVMLAEDLGELECGQAPLPGARGCIDQASDIDVVRFESTVDCNGEDPHIEISLRYPVALVPMILELLDADGNVIATGEVCTPGTDFSGTEHLCIQFVPDQTSYFVRVAPDPDGPDCDGACHYNQYTLDIIYPLA